jgi:hypothetical protein
MEAIDDAPRVEAQIATEIDDQAAAEKEKENAAAQRKAGDVAVLRMTGKKEDLSMTSLQRPSNSRTSALLEPLKRL